MGPQAPLHASQFACPSGGYRVPGRILLELETRAGRPALTELRAAENSRYLYSDFFSRVLLLRPAGSQHNYLEVKLRLGDRAMEVSHAGSGGEMILMDKANPQGTYSSRNKSSSCSGGHPESRCAVVPRVCSLVAE